MQDFGQDFEFLPPFIQKLYVIVMDPGTDNVVSWDDSGTELVIFDKR